MFLTTGDDAISASTAIGFSFNFGGTLYTSFKANTNGWMTFDVAATTTTNYSAFSTGTVNQVIACFNRDIVCDGGVNYELTGTTPNQILKIQWAGIRSFSSTTVPATGACQIWLYETSNNIEVYYDAYTAGTRTVGSTVQVGLRGASTAAANMCTASGTTWPGAIQSSSNTATVTISTTALPDAGRKYTFNFPCTVAGLGISATSTTICSGESTTITATPAGGSYLWSPGGATTDAITVSPGTSTTYVCAVTVAGCTNNISQLITVNQSPTGVTADATPLTVCEGDPITLTSSSDPLPGYTMNPAGSATFLDISGTGTLIIAPTLLDDSEHSMVLPSAFTLNGTTYTDISVGNNGVIMFNNGAIVSPNVGFTNGALYSALGTLSTQFSVEPALLPFWDDMTPGTGGSLATQYIAPIYYVQWTNEDHFSAPGTGTATFQVQLDYSTGQIHYVYSDVVFGGAGQDNGASATVGMQINSTYFYQNSFNSAVISNGQCITFTPNAASYSWSGPDAYSSSNQNDVATSTSTGTYTVTVTNTANGCAVSATTASVTVNPYVTYYADADGDGEGDASDPGTSMCPDPGAGYSLNNLDCNDGDASINTSGTEVCNGMDDNCDGNTDEGLITAVITPGGPTTFCQGSNVVLSANTGGGYTYQWKNGGSNIPGATNGSLTVSVTAASITVVATIPGGCSDESDPVATTRLARPTANVINADATNDLCFDASIKLKANLMSGVTYQWYKGGTLLAGETNYLYFATTPGNYKVYLTSTVTGCSDISPNYLIIQTCREGDLNADNAISIYPNPASNEFTVDVAITTTETLATIQLFNLMGDVVYNTQASINNGIINEQISLGDQFASGIYLVKVTTGTTELTEQIVIQK